MLPGPSCTFARGLLLSPSSKLYIKICGFKTMPKKVKCRPSYTSRVKPSAQVALLSKNLLRSLPSEDPFQPSPQARFAVSHSIKDPFPPFPTLTCGSTFLRSSFLQVSMQRLTFKTRAVYQNTPASSCQELAGVCIDDAIVLIFIVVFVGGLLFLTLVRNFCAWRRTRREDHAESDNNPPPYSGIGFPPSTSGDLALYKESPSPSLDPYHVIAPSFDNSLLLKDSYFSRVTYPDPTVAPNQQRASGLPSGVVLDFKFSGVQDPSTPAAPPHSDVSLLISPPPAYVREPRRHAAVKSDV
ncbi:hypothetical protein B0H12DRAFT_1148061 [Mycena haematopus]|nr:hypothetical protein B0H12DRAFT_1148061 [Mycena haematopus]